PVAVRLCHVQIHARRTAPLRRGHQPVARREETTRIDRQDVSARRGGRGAPFTGREYASEGGYADGQDHREAVMGRAPERGPGAVPDAAKTDEATMPDTSQKTYWDYLSLLPLLELQGGLEGDDRKLSEDELHFIIVHQVFELWLKL